jgi:hypothetical protein
VVIRKRSAYKLQLGQDNPITGCNILQKIICWYGEYFSIFVGGMKDIEYAKLPDQNYGTGWV